VTTPGAEVARRTREAQDLPERVVDIDVLAQVAAQLSQNENRESHSDRTPGSSTRSTRRTPPGQRQKVRRA
jgi:hypothetical protein